MARSLFFIAFPSAFAATVRTAGAADAQSLEGVFRGRYVCEQFQSSPDILHVPLDISLHGSNVTFARPLFNWNRTRVLGCELDQGTVDADGKLHISSTWYSGGLSFEANYNGTLTPAGGTLSGTQMRRGAEGSSGSRTCNAAFVPAPKPRHEIPPH